MYFSRLLILLVCFSVKILNVNAQNFGLTHPQDFQTLPQSQVKVQQPQLKHKINPQSDIKLITTNEWTISGGWELAEGKTVMAQKESPTSSNINTSKWYNATVPGTVLTTLVNQGVYPDPYFGLNNLAITDSLCRTDWWYRTNFKLPGSPDNKKIWLKLNGINYKAIIWLNGTCLGEITGAFCTAEFDITDVVNKNNDNILAVHISPPPNPGIPHEESPRAGQGPNGGQLCLDGPTFISSEGWDWVPGIRDRNIGIWQDVRLKYTNEITIRNPQVITDLPLPDTSIADITIRALVSNLSKTQQVVKVTGIIDQITIEKTVELPAEQSKQIEFSASEFPQLHLVNPRLWWPNGYGKPNLYTLKLSVATVNNIESDVTTTRFGIREFSYELSVSENKNLQRVEFNPVSNIYLGKPLFDNVKRMDVGDGVSVPTLKPNIEGSVLTHVSDTTMSPYMVIKVNGKRIFCKGGNWGMDDAMKNVSREHLEPYFRLHRDANFNMVRNWTGESTEEVFYDLCDEYGLLVWNDFWLSTEGYNLNVNDDDLFLKNAKDVIIRFRNHPSIVVWCPRNEGYAPAYIENGLANLIAKEDGTRYYQGNSRYLNLRPSGPWHYFTNASDYFTMNAKGFNTELGTPSVPTAQSIRKMMPEQDLWPINDTWYYHDLHDGQKDYCQAIDKLYGTASGLDDFCKKAQMINYDSHRAMFEAWNSKLWNNTSGLLLWMTHPAWPSMVWQVYSWDYETFGSYFGSKKACEPIHVQMNLNDNKVVIVNTSLKTFPSCKVKLSVFDLNGKIMFEKEQKTNVTSNALTNVFTNDFSPKTTGVYLVRISLMSKNGELLSENEYWKTNAADQFKKFSQIGNAQLNGKLLKAENGTQKKLTFLIENTSEFAAIGIKCNLQNANSKDIILPAYFSDGYFNLMPHETKKVSVSFTENLPVELMVEAFNAERKTLFVTPSTH